VESSNEIKEKKNQLRNHLLYLLVWPFGLSYRWSSEVPDTHIFYGLIFCITIIGIPFGKMHFRLAKLALSPFGKELG